MGGSGRSRSAWRRSPSGPRHHSRSTPLCPGPLRSRARSSRASTRDGTLPRALAKTLARFGVGYGVALLVGIPLGIALARSRFVKQSFGPIVLGLSSVPSICWLPLAILWFGLWELAIQVVVVCGAALPIAIATENAVRHVPPSIERAARTMGARGARLLLTVTLPAALPGILGGAKLGWTFALRSLMAGELLFVSGGLGQLLETGRDLGDTALVLAIVVVIVVVGRASEWALFGRLDRFVAAAGGRGTHERLVHAEVVRPVVRGKVWLVGAGPGDPELLTVRAARFDRRRVRHRVRRARAAGASSIWRRRPAERIPVGRRAGGCRHHEARIHPAVIERALEGIDVVRLKCGDPFVFGRGGEEAEELAAARVPFEVVPGVTAALGAAAAAHVPLTHRDCARR